MDGSAIRKGAVDAVMEYVRQVTGNPNLAFPAELSKGLAASRAREARRWPWHVMGRVLGIIYLKDIVKGGIKERFAELRAMGHSHRHDHRR